MVKPQIYLCTYTACIKIWRETQLGILAFDFSGAFYFPKRDLAATVFCVRGTIERLPLGHDARAELGCAGLLLL